MGASVWPYPDAFIIFRGEKIHAQLTAHRGSGQWRKRHAKRDYYFGPIHDPRAALARWRVEWPRIIGYTSEVVTHTRTITTLQDGCKAFLADRLSDFDRGDMEWSSYRDYRNVKRIILAAIGDDVAMQELGDAHLRDLLNALVKYSPKVRMNMVIKCRSILRGAARHAGVSLDIPDWFTGPRRKIIRADHAGKRHKLFASRAFHRLLIAAEDAGDHRMVAILLCAINTGTKPADMARWLTADVDLNTGWLKTIRGKTSADQVSPLWPETLWALRRVCDPKRKLLFVNDNGNPIQTQRTFTTSKWFHALATSANVEGTFEWVRYTFSTAAAPVRDREATQIIQGHTLDGVPDGYVLSFPKGRLLTVSEHVRMWFLNRDGDRPG